MSAPTDVEQKVRTPRAPVSGSEPSLGRTASRSAATAAVGQVLRLVVQSTGIVVLARLLEPADYGVLALATAVTALGELFRDFGLANASVQARTLSASERNNLFWVNAMIGTALAALTAAAAAPIATLLHVPALAGAIAVLAVTFLLNGVQTQARASLVRSMRFVGINAIDTGALLTGTVTGVVLAALGAGYWSLIAMLVVQALVACLLVWTQAGWAPRLPDRGTSIRHFLRFGTELFLSQVLGYVAKNLSTFVIGISIGLVPLGLFNRANQLLSLPIAQLQAPATQIALPTLARLQDDGPRYDRFLLRGQMALLHLTTLVLALSGANAVALFSLFLGSKWIGAAGVFQILAVGGFAMVANYATYWVFLSRDLMRSYLKLSLIMQPANIVAILLGARGGLAGIVLATTIVNFLIWPTSLLWLRRVSSIPAGTLFRNTARALAAYGSAGAAASALVSLTEFPPILSLVVGSAAVLGVLAIWVALSRSFRGDLKGLLEIARLVFERRRAGA